MKTINTIVYSDSHNHGLEHRVTASKKLTFDGARRALKKAGIAAVDVERVQAVIDDTSIDRRKDGSFRRRNQAASKGAPRKMWSGRLPVSTHDQLLALVASGAHKSQADAIAHAVSALANAKVCQRGQPLPSTTDPCAYH